MPTNTSSKHEIHIMKKMFYYIYYRIAKFYKNTFGIEDSPSYLLIQSCYSWGLLVLVMALWCYTLALETVILWYFGIRMKTMYIIITILPGGLFYFFAEHFLGDLKMKFKALENTYQNEKLSWLKGICVALFVTLSLVSLFVALSYCK